MDRDKYRRLFLDEAHENLRAYANGLVAFERLESHGDTLTADHTEVMDGVFRAAHSLKGMAAAMGYEPFANLAHQLEDLADLARKRIALGAGGYDLLLEGGDALEKMLQQIEAGDEDTWPSSDLPQRVATWVQQRKQPATSQHTGQTADAPPPPGSDVPVSSPQAEGELVIEARMAADTPFPQVRAFMLHRTVSALAGYRSTEPAPESLRQALPPDQTIRFRFDSRTADEARLLTTAQAAQGVAEVTLIHTSSSPKPTSAVARAGESEERTIRVRTTLLDDFIDLVAELLLARSRLRGVATQSETPELTEIVDDIERLARDFHDKVVTARMTPISFVTERLPRLVRDLSRQTGKDVELSIAGEGIEIDRAILDDLFTPLLHMIRNAVDHGHEGSAAREAAGKSATMKLALRASRERDRVLIELEDDGGGIDPHVVRNRALERGLIDAKQLEELPVSRWVELICLPGFSTKTEVTQTSGRGVGMDVVKASLERLGGRLRIASVIGEGTRFTLRLPLTVAILRVLVVEVGHGQARGVFAIPVARVDKALDLEPGMVVHSHGKHRLPLGDVLIPIYDLATELGFDAVPALERGTAIITGQGDDYLAFRVNAVLGQEEVVAKPLGRPLSQVRYLSGGTLLADGQAAFILEPQRLVESSTG